MRRFFAEAFLKGLPLNSSQAPRESSPENISLQDHFPKGSRVHKIMSWVLGIGTRNYHILGSILCLVGTWNFRARDILGYILV